jgi:hypothetical protein
MKATEVKLEALRPSITENLYMSISAIALQFGIHPWQAMTAFHAELHSLLDEVEKGKPPMESNITTPGENWKEGWSKLTVLLSERLKGVGDIGDGTSADIDAAGAEDAEQDGIAGDGGVGPDSASTGEENGQDGPAEPSAEALGGEVVANGAEEPLHGITS